MTHTVSIITMTCTYNYGATLQAYALQSFMEQLGCTCSIINHMGYEGHRTVRIPPITKDSILKFPFRRQLEKGYYNFEQFYDRYMHMTLRYHSLEELERNPPQSDLFITGSDQVWNPRDFRNEFYLSFAPTSSKKISYAASIGVSVIPDSVKGSIKDYLESFDQISVREENAFEQISQLTSIPVQKNCDPVYLLSREEWSLIGRPIKGLPEDYILCYMIYKPQWLNSWLRKVKKQTGRPIVVMDLQGYRLIYCDKHIRIAGPREFVWLIEHASAVVTSSFHGAAFSIIFGKPFVALPDPPRPDRLHNLLSMFGLEDNLLYEDNTDNVFRVYNSSSIETVIHRERDKSKRYLLNSLYVCH